MWHTAEYYHKSTGERRMVTFKSRATRRANLIRYAARVCETDTLFHLGEFGGANLLTVDGNAI